MLVFTEARDTLESLQSKLRASSRSRRSRTTVSSRWPSATARWRASAIPTGRRVLLSHRGRRRGPQLPVRAPPGELRPALEPGHDGAAHRPARSHRPDAARSTFTSSRRRAPSAPTCSPCCATRWACSARRSAASTRCSRRSSRGSPSSRWPSRSDRAAYVKELTTRVSEARGAGEAGVRSAARSAQLRSQAVKELVAARPRSHRAWTPTRTSSLEDGLWAVARDLDERLEESITELADRIGIRVDTDQEVDAFQCAFHFGHALNVEALPGLRHHRRAHGARHLLARHRRGAGGDRVLRHRAPAGRGAVRLLARRPLRAQRRPLPRGEEAPEGARGSRCSSTSSRRSRRTPRPARGCPSRQLSRFLESMLVQVAVVPPGRRLGQGRLEAASRCSRPTTGGSLKGQRGRRRLPRAAQLRRRGRGGGDRARPRSQLEAMRKAAMAAIEDERDLSIVRIAWRWITRVSTSRRSSRP